MKSIFLTFLFFIVVFSVAKLDVLALLNHWGFRYGALLLFFIVLGCAIHFIGFLQKDRNSVKQEKKEETNAEK